MHKIVIGFVDLLKCRDLIILWNSLTMLVCHLCTKSLVNWLSTCAAIEVSEEQKDEEPKQSTDGVSVKDTPKVKLVIEKSLITQKYKS